MPRTDGPDAGERIVCAAAVLLNKGGREAVTTRAVSAAAGVQSPTIYRHFGDMRGLLDAAASRGFADYLQTKKSRPREADPVDDLRRGWDLSVEFGLAHPAVYAILYGDPRPDARPEAVVEAHAVLHRIIHRIAQAGRLQVSVDRAADMMHSACRGVTLNLISMPPDERDSGLSEALREAVLSVITTDVAVDRDAGDDLLARRAIALKAVLPESRALMPSEAALLSDWLDRIASGPA
ncbi:TetR/AcrR family transcriptional regulator [Mycolicibacterium sp. XJ870]